MALAMGCPKCQALIDLSQQDSDGRIICRGCGAKLRINRPRTSKAPPPKAPPPKAQLAPLIESGPTSGDPRDVFERHEDLEPLASNESSNPAGDTDWLDGDFDLSDLVPSGSTPSATNWPHAASQSMRHGQPAGMASQADSEIVRSVSAKKKKKNRQRMMLIGGICGGGVILVMLGIGTMALLVSQIGSSVGDGSNEGNASNNAGDISGSGTLWAAEWEGGEIPSLPVTFDTPVDAASDTAQPTTDSSRLVQAEPFDEAAHQPWINPIVEQLESQESSNSNEQTAEAIILDDGPRWEAEADPAPAEAGFQVAADIGIPPRPTHVWRTVIRIADRGGPFLLMPPNWEVIPRGDHFADPAAGSSFAPIEVIDVRSGEIAGVFNWRIPFHMEGALSPDGNRFLGPYHVPHPNLFESDEEIREALNGLYVWQRDSDQPPRKLSIPGFASWFGFVDAHTVAILIEQPVRELQFWDLATCQKRSGVELPSDDRYQVHPDVTYGVLMQRYHQRNDVALSPGGRYAAVVTGETLSMVSIEDATILGETEPFLPTGTDEPVQGLSFSPQGTEIVVVFPGAAGVHLLQLSAVDGRRVLQQQFATTGETGAENGWGPLFPGPRAGSWIQASRITYRRNSATVYYEFGRSQAIRLPINEILLVPGQGPLMVDANRSPPDPAPMMFAMDRTTLGQVIGTALRESLGPPVAVDRSGRLRIAPELPQAWQSLDGMEPSVDDACSQLPTAPWSTCWGDARIGAFIEFSQDDRPTFGSIISDYLWMIDRATGLPIQEPIELRRWRYGSNRHRPPRVMAMSPDGAQFVVSDPLQYDRLDVWSTDGTWRFGFHPFEKSAVLEWAGFDAEGRLLVAGGGAIARFELGLESVTALYETEDTHYLFPFELGPDRKRLFASRGHSLDVLDVSTGQILTRLGINAGRTNASSDRIITDFSVSPDGEHAAAVYVHRMGSAGIMRRLRSSNQGQKVILGIWNLQSGEALKYDGVEIDYVAELSWGGPDMLVIGDYPVKFLDLRSGLVIAEYALEFGQGDDWSIQLGATTDNRIWKCYGEDPDQTGLDPAWRDLGGTLVREHHVSFWQPSVVSDDVSDIEAPVYAEDRQTVSLYGQPIRLTIDIGDPHLAALRSTPILQDLQERGFLIGADGLELHVVAQTSDSHTSIEEGGPGGRRVYVPKIDYQWSLRDQDGRTMWSATTSGEPDLTASRYLKEKWRGIGSPFDFRGMPMHEAFAKEILETGEGFELAEDIPTGFMFTAGHYVRTPIQLRE